MEQFFVAYIYRWYDRSCHVLCALVKHRLQPYFQKIDKLSKKRVPGLPINLGTLFVILLQLTLVVLYIAHMSRYTTLSYECQKYVREIKLLRSEKESLENSMHQAALPERIKKYACERHTMVPVSLRQIKQAVV
jgi:hypothetical protein